MYMRKIQYFQTVLSTMSLLAFLTACTSPSLLTNKVSSVWPEATEVIEVGYRGITEKYINYIPVDQLALDGINGFSAIDPALRVQRYSELITLSYSDIPIISVKTPNKLDVHGWAKLTSKFALAARAYSTDMKAANAEKLYEAVFDGALSKLDLFSRYAGALDAHKNRALRDGFGGIGIGFKRKAGVLHITNVTPNTPASAAGLQSNDVITHINRKSVSHLTIHQIKDLIRGLSLKTISLTVIKAGLQTSQAYKLAPKHIIHQTVTEKRLNNILYFKVSSFNQGTAQSLSIKLKTAISEMGDTLVGVVLDLRGNPGGLLKQSVKVADLFLSQGTIISTKGRHIDSLHKYVAGGSDLADGRPLMVLIDGKSASAAEIVAAALQDRERAILIGTSSYGKGTVQSVLRLPNDGEITLTWSRFIAPSGYILQGLGVRPSLCIRSKPETVENLVTVTMSSVLDIKSIFQKWRSVLLMNDVQRKSLRSTCQAEQTQTGTELDVAKHIIANPTSYARIMGLSSTSNHAHK
jgi:carboxyl-terminal processing protease